MVPAHILDPEGDVILVVRNPNPPFAVWESPSNEEPTSSSPTTPKEEKTPGILLELSEITLDKQTTTPAPEVHIQASAKHLTLGS
ncbi:uncharacterized protein BDV14DRAFT_171281 [Aspergillus stella-maris]|uniref:uncharacterized protein n=1 Tax=Aspergillus stella-maris TaxID=1810926 RepID=UPI003CCD8F39